MNYINEQGYYVGPEVQWSVKDVEMLAEARNIKLTAEELANILTTAFKDNENMMETMFNAISDTMSNMTDKKQSKQ